MLDLHHERGESGIAPLVVTFATGDQSCLTDADRVTPGSISGAATRETRA